MKDLLEILVFLGGNILIWGKILSMILGISTILYGCYKLTQYLENTRLLRSS